MHRETTGTRAYCFRCDLSDWLPAPPRTLAQIMEDQREAREADAQMQRAGVALPEPLLLADRAGEWPGEARLWLARAGLGSFEIARLGAGYHPPSNRVVLPVYGPAGLVYWQARSIDGRAPKYLGSPAGRSRAVPKWGSGAAVCVTEDILSAYKIGLSGCEAWCALGVKANSRFMADLMQSGKPALVWLDPDPAGQAGAAKLMKQLRAYGVPATNIISRADPKLMQRTEIRHAVKERLEGG